MLKTLRAKLTLWYVLLLGAVLGFFSVFLYLTMERNLRENLDNKLLTTGRMLAASLARPFGPGPSLAEVDKILRENFGLRPMGRFVQILDETGKRTSNLRDVDIPVSFKTLEQVSQGREVFETVRLRDGALLRLVTVPIIDRGRMLGIVQVGSPLEEIQEALDQLLLVLSVSVPLVLVLASLGGLFLADQALKPVDRITRTAQKIGSGDLSQRIPLEGLPRDEIGRLAETFNEMISRLESSFEQMKRFTADASHELKTPLSILRGEVEVGLMRERSPAEYQEILKSCLEEIGRMSRIVDDLLTLARTDLGSLGLRLERLDLMEVAEEVWRGFYREAVARGLKFSLEGTRVEVLGDREKLRRAIANLVDNAVKYTPDGGYIKVEVGSEDDFATVSVSDTGEGIPPEHQERVFDRFYRVDKARSRERGGTGLGLSICKGIVEAHGGRISLESEPGVGSTFKVFLPLRKAREKALDQREKGG